MPRCNLTLKQKSQMIELSGELNTEQLAKRFRVHPTTVTRTLKKQEKILYQAARVNPNFKTVQTNFKSEQHDALLLDFILAKQQANEPITVNDVCDKAVEFAADLGRQIKSKRAWWRRFKVRCNIIKSKTVKNSLGVRLHRTMADEQPCEQKQQAQPTSPTSRKPKGADLKRPKRTGGNKKSAVLQATAAPVIGQNDQLQQAEITDGREVLKPAAALPTEPQASTEVTMRLDLPTGSKKDLD